MIETEPLPQDRPDSRAENVVELRAARREERKQAVIEFVRDHPGLSVAGGILAGILVSSLLPRRPVRKLARGTVKVADVVGTTAMVLGRNAADRAEHAGAAAAGRIGAFGHVAADQMEKLSELAVRRIGQASGTAATAVGAAGETAADHIGRLLVSAETQVERRGRRIGRRAKEIRKDLRKRLRRR